MIYIQYNTTFIIAPLPLLLFGVAATNQAFAFSGDWGYPQLGPGAYENGYSAGIADAVYDHNNDLSYNPVGSCLPCHSEVYWNGFHHGYDTQWNTYQSSQQTVNNYVTVNGNGNEVYLNQRQDSNQLGGGPWGFSQSGCCGGNGPGQDK